MIRGVAKKLIEHVRAEDHVCRIGGEEFLLILPNCSAENAFDILDRTRQFIESSNLAQRDLDRSVTMSFGAVTLVPNLDTAPGPVIKAADLALYRAKGEGRNKVVIDAI